ncbi:MAG: DUF4339 domain-containing protein [Gammaproteobacteria bacterium]|nr:DUF4339 domain-containing protein [Gammaproteobacteria bacterium]
MVTDQPQWYVQKGSRVQGPFSSDEVGRFLLLGRVRNTDRVSRDGELWEPVTQVPELIPEELLDLHSESGWERFLEVRSANDERSEPPEPVNVERRREDVTADIKRDWHRPISVSTALPWSLLGITLAALCMVLYLNNIGLQTGQM